MKVSTIASAIALCTLASTSPLEARDSKTKTVIRYKTKTETETDTLTKYKTRTVTDVKVRTTTKTKTVISKPTTRVVTTTSTLPAKTSTVFKSTTIVLPTTKLGTVTSIKPTTIATTQFVTAPASTLTLIQSINGPNVTVTESVQGPTITATQTVYSSDNSTQSVNGSTTTVTESIQGPTITAIQTMYPSGNSTGGVSVVVMSKTVTVYPTDCPLTTDSTSTSASTSASATASASASATPTFDNVKTASCTDPKAYYIQVDGTGTVIDGTVMLGGDGAFRAFYAAPGTGPWGWGSVAAPFLYDQATGQLSDYRHQANVLIAYDSSDDSGSEGVLGSYPPSSAVGSALTCSVDDDLVLDCSASLDGSQHSGIHIDADGGPSYYYPWLNDYDLGYRSAHNATFTLIGACDV